MSNAKRKNRKKFIWLGLIICVGAGVGAYFYFRKREVIITVQTEKVSPRSITELVVANGKIQPVIQVVINPEVSGEITELPVKEGQPVKKGDLLVKLKPDNYLAARNSAQATSRSGIASKALAQANLTKAEIELKRAKDLAASKLISESELLDAQTSFDVMKASYDTSVHQAEQSVAALARAEDDLAKTTIYAPMAGIVTKLKSQRGERVVGTALMAGTEIMTVADLDEMEARVDIGEVDVVLIQTGQVARLEVDAFRERKFSGVVTEIANSSKTSGPSGSSSSSSSSQSQEATKFEVKIRVQEKETFRPGMSVTAEIETRYRSNVLAVPIQSVTTRVPKKTNAAPAQSSSIVNTARASSDGPKKDGEKRDRPIEVLFALEGDHVKMVPVKRGISDDAYVEITEGVKEGLEVIAGGYKAINRELEDGKRVKVGPPEEKPEKDEKK
ncbi:MAG TPA: efflux RND transporter periplasmic adaptor subunit [Methylomirabilota bacterium]|nr:efflux RND transporter periplasmic adaptor subunit [Methylomirabilota bacterium]